MWFDTTPGATSAETGVYGLHDSLKSCRVRFDSEARHHAAMTDW